MPVWNWCNDMKLIFNEVSTQFGLGGISVPGAYPLGGGYTNKNYFIETPKGKFVLKEKKFKKNVSNHIKIEYKLIDHLLNKKPRVPVPNIYLTKSIRKPYIYIRKYGSYFILYEFIRGKHVDWGEMVDRKFDRKGNLVWINHIKLLKAASILACIHYNLSSFPEDKGIGSSRQSFPKKFNEGYSRFKVLEKMLKIKIKKGEMLNRYEEYAIGKIDFILEQYKDISRRFLSSKYNALPKQIIHGDFSPVNLLFDGKNDLIAVIDWESIVIDTRLIDFVKGIYQVWNNATVVEEMLRFIEKYEERAISLGGNRLSSKEIAALPYIHRMHHLNLLSELASPSSIIFKIMVPDPKVCPHCRWPYSDNIDPLDFFEMQMEPLRYLRSLNLKSILRK